MQSKSTIAGCWHSKQIINQSMNSFTSNNNLFFIFFGFVLFNLSGFSICCFLFSFYINVVWCRSDSMDEKEKKKKKFKMKRKKKEFKMYSILRCKSMSVTHVQICSCKRKQNWKNKKTLMKFIYLFIFWSIINLNQRFQFREYTSVNLSK